jgi:hypothetical protein
VRGTIGVDARTYLPEKVLETVRATLLDRFSFASRSLGQSVVASEVIAVIQGVTGVAFVDLDGIERVIAPLQVAPSLKRPDRLDAAVPSQGANDVLFGAELLTLSPLGIELTTELYHG